MLTAIIYDKWLSGLGGGEVVACTIARLLKDGGYEVTFASTTPISPRLINDKLALNLSDIKFVQVKSEEDLNKLAPDLFINISFMDYSYGLGKNNIYYVHFPSRIRSGLFNHILAFFQQTNFHRYFPSMLRERIDDRLRAGIYTDMRRRLASYDTFICHSEFVQKWIKRMWNVDAEVIYPPVRFVPGSKANKKNRICSVGRFFTLGHGKKQEILIEAFRQLYDSGLQQWELHLVGGVGTEPSTVRYVEGLKKMARGYPIFFHLNVDRDEVENILLQSKIYWHAGGYGETDPINLEHFGIAPVEAISAGCLPILFNGGGLPEIICKLDLNPRLHLFTVIDGLVDATRELISQKQDMESVQKKLDMCFSTDSFTRNFLKTIQETLP